MAGLYEWWKDPAKADDDAARWMLSFTILTRDSIGHLGSIHDRMPLFLDPDHADAWLDPTTDNVRDVLDAAIDAAPAVAETLDDHVVSKAVGNVRNNSPELIEPVRRVADREILAGQPAGVQPAHGTRPRPCAASARRAVVTRSAASSRRAWASVPAATAATMPSTIRAPSRPWRTSTASTMSLPAASAATALATGSGYAGNARGLQHPEVVRDAQRR